MKYLELAPSGLSKGVGAGENINIVGDRVTGSLLAHNKRMVHFTAHPRFN